MRLFWCLIFFAAGYFFYPDESYKNLPFAQWNLELLDNFVFHFVGAILIWITGIKLLASSIEGDKIWPWRWNKRYLFSLFLKSVAISAWWSFVYYLLSKQAININESKGMLLVMILIGFSIISSLCIMIAEEDEVYNFINDRKLKQ